MAIENNMVVSLEYEVIDKASGEVVDSNIGGMSLDFITGKGHIIPGLENEVVKLNSGDSAQISVEPKDAYGNYDENAVDKVPIEQFAGIELQKGMPLYAQSEDGDTIQVNVIDFDDEFAIIDYNHPLAGKELLFNVTVLSVREPTEEEKQTGQVEIQHDDTCSNGSCGCGY